MWRLAAFSWYLSAGFTTGACSFPPAQDINERSIDVMNETCTYEAAEHAAYLACSPGMPYLLPALLYR